MNYYQAKLVLSKSAPQISWNALAIEAAALVAVAGVLVRIFA